jgi:hypothetical protein
MSEKEARIGMTENWGSVHGIIRPETLKREGEGATALVVGVDGVETRIKGYGEDLADLFETAAQRGEPVILRGHILGSGPGESEHLQVLIAGPAVFRGVISDITRSAEGKTPHVSFWLMNEAHDGDGNMFTYLTGVNVHGAEAEVLTDLQDGDQVIVEVRDGPYGHIATSPVTVIPRAEPASEDEPGI